MRSSTFTMDQVHNIFTEELATRGGRVTDTYKDGNRLFSRSILPHVKDVRPRDRLQGGVAIKATQEEICIYPYIFRLVCSNGAIVAETLEARIISDLNQLEPYTIVESIHEGIATCSQKKVFTQTVSKMHRSSQKQINQALDLLAYFTGHSTLINSEMIKRIMDRFFAETDHSQFGLANAVTSIARDTPNPQTRWNLEALGGAIAIAAPTSRPKRGAPAVRVTTALAIA